VIRLEVVLAREDPAPRAICTGGRQPSPAEDCGGGGGYALLVAATDPGHPDHVAARAEYAELYGPDVDPQGWAPTPFDIDWTNLALADLGAIASAHEITGPPRDLLDAVRTTDGQHQLRRLLGSARLRGPVLIAADTAAAAVRPYAWLLDRVGDDGIKLTQAGYLPPVHVEAAFSELGFDKVWIGAGNREDLTYPVLELRQSAQRIGLLRKHRGRLLATAGGGRCAPTRSDCGGTSPSGHWSRPTTDVCTKPGCCIGHGSRRDHRGPRHNRRGTARRARLDSRRRLADHSTVGGRSNLRGPGHPAPDGLVTAWQIRPGP
jgi:hypothetical protein